MKLSELNELEIGKINEGIFKGKTFIVLEKLSNEAYTDTIIKGFGRHNFVWDKYNPEVSYVAKGDIKMVVNWRD